MADTEKQKTGKLGENLACEYLRQRGFSIVDRNYWRKWGEIDIVAQKEGILHFIEVKTVTREQIREDDDDYEPEDNLHPWKRQRLRRVIETYLLNQKDDPDWQVDAISVYLNRAGATLKIECLADLVL